ncbi:hypothetical protein [Rhizobium sp. 2MFCol3.1]|uniref:hypothetical protein n=1 Tax=Rhizobium sp. 2MFCol3.1 TaxID=1246459 RepID=UPI0003774248|nr:hypothetical protein [Rhizobium sp. 2MFCol3.1]
MAKVFKIAGEQTLTQNGKLGAWLFVLSPLASGLCYYWFLVEAGKTYGGQPEIPLALMVGAGLAFLGGLVMIIVGRSYSYRAYEEEQKPAESGGLWSK